MRKCPVCGSLSFDDMDTCFGCMHAFESSDSDAIPESVLAACAVEPDDDIEPEEAVAGGMIVPMVTDVRAARRAPEMETCDAVASGELSGFGALGGSVRFDRADGVVEVRIVVDFRNLPA